MRGTATPLTKGPFSLTLPDTAGPLTIPADASGGGLSNDLLDWLINIDVFMTPVSQSGFTGLFAENLQIYNGYVIGGQNEYICFDEVIAKGTWTIELFFVKYATAGIYTVQFNDVTKGTIDAYSAGTSYNERDRITGIAVGDTGKVRIKLVMSTKNASSGGYGASLSHIQLRRTA